MDCGGEDQPGSGIGLLLVATGLLMLISTVIMLVMRPIRTMEQFLPDYFVNDEN